MKKKFRVGIIGCGGISGSHIWGIKEKKSLKILYFVSDIFKNNLWKRFWENGFVDTSWKNGVEQKLK